MTKPGAYLGASEGLKTCGPTIYIKCVRSRMFERKKGKENMTYTPNTLCDEEYAGSGDFLRVSTYIQLSPSIEHWLDTADYGELKKGVGCIKLKEKRWGNLRCNTQPEA